MALVGLMALGCANDQESDEAIDFLNNNPIAIRQLHSENFEILKRLERLDYQGIDVSFAFDIKEDRRFNFEMIVDDCAYVDPTNARKLVRSPCLDYAFSISEIQNIETRIEEISRFDNETIELYYIDLTMRTKSVPSYNTSLDLINCDSSEDNEVPIEEISSITFFVDDENLMNQFISNIELLRID
jgi:hypothetical protein